MEIQYNVPRTILTNCVFNPSIVYNNAMSVIGGQMHTHSNEFVQKIHYYYIDNNGFLKKDFSVYNTFTMSVEDVLSNITKQLHKIKSKFVGFSSKEYNFEYYQSKLTENKIKFDIESDKYEQKIFA